MSGDEVRVYEVAEDGSLIVVEHPSNALEYGTGA